MKYVILTESQIKTIINEKIHPHEAYNDYDSVKTVVDGKRNLCVVNFISDSREQRNVLKLIGKYKLKLLKVTSNPFNMYIVYKDGNENDALELNDICERNSGFLPSNSDDTYRIGELLGYYDHEIKGKKNN